MSSIGIGYVKNDLASYYSSVDGGQCLFTVNNKFDSIRTTEQGFIYMINPNNSGKNLCIHRIRYGSDQNSMVMTYRDPTVAGGSVLSPINRTYGSLTSVAQVFGVTVTSVFTISVPGTQTKTRGIQAYSDTESIEDGTSIIPPGHSVIWTAMTSNGIHSVWGDIIWWEK